MCTTARSHRRLMSYFLMPAALKCSRLARRRPAAVAGASSRVRVDSWTDVQDPDHDALKTEADLYARFEIPPNASHTPRLGEVIKQDADAVAGYVYSRLRAVFNG